MPQEMKTPPLSPASDRPAVTQHPLPPAFPLPLPILTGDGLAAHVWDEDEICLHSVGSLQGMGPPSMATIFDFRLRRWYKIISDREPPDLETENADDILEDPYWFDILRKSGHRGRDDFNEIHVSLDDTISAYRLNPIERSGIPIYGLAPPPPSTYIPTVIHHELRNRQYLFRSTETCTWGDQQRVVFKQIMMGWGEVAEFHREIRLLHCLRKSEHFLPVLAYVTDEYGRMRGFLSPYGGISLDKLSTVRWWYLLGALEGMREIHSISLGMLEASLDNEEGDSEHSEHAEHGDICARNIVVDECGKVYLIDGGNKVWDYQGDRIALAEMADGLREKAETQEDAKRIDQISWLLRGKDPLDDIIRHLRNPERQPIDI